MEIFSTITLYLNGKKLFEEGLPKLLGKRTLQSFLCSLIAVPRHIPYIRVYITQYTTENATQLIKNGENHTETTGSGFSTSAEALLWTTGSEESFFSCLRRLVAGSQRSRAISLQRQNDRYISSTDTSKLATFEVKEWAIHCSNFPRIRRQFPSACFSDMYNLNGVLSERKVFEAKLWGKPLGPNFSL